MDALFVEQSLPLAERFRHVRQYTEQLVASLSEADAQIQSMADASPAKWHLAHTTWFFETFILKAYCQHYQPVNPAYNYLFNSYYNGIGEQYPRHQRGLISRPSLQAVMEYRHAVDHALLSLLQHQDRPAFAAVLELGLQHEQQHQELLLTDIKHALFQNPLYPAYIPSEKVPESCSELPLHWLYFEGGLTTIGFNGAGFSFDNERPAHTVYIQPFQLASRLVTKGEFLEFIDSDAYNNPEYWLADGWAWRQQSQQQCPLYWLRQDERWFEYTLYGLQPLDRQQALIHVNYYEASAYANWSGVRLPTEFEWEYAVNKQLVTPDKNKGDLAQCFGCAWQWTSSSYSAYPGFRPFAGLAGEYNGKFMSNQYVLRGSSCVTSAGHARTSYRNFFYGHQSWQFTGIRLAQ